MKHQALFSSKEKSKKKKNIKVSSAAILLGSFRVKRNLALYPESQTYCSHHPSFFDKSI